MGQVDFSGGQTYRKIQRCPWAEITAPKMLVFPMDGELKAKVLHVEDLIGLKLQALTNDPKRLCGLRTGHSATAQVARKPLDIALVREYFRSI